MIDTEPLPDRAAELSPSEVRADEMTGTRVAGMIGAAVALLGAVAVVANHYGPRWIGPGMGYLLAAGGLAAMLYWAARDGEQEVRRGFTWFGYLLLAAFVVTALVSVFGTSGEGVVVRIKRLPILATGGSIVPGFVGALALAFLAVPQRHETDAKKRDFVLAVLLAVGGLLTVGSVLFGVFKPETLIGPGAAAAVLGLAYLAAFLAFTDTADGLGYLVAVLLGVVGGAAVIYAIGQSVLPTVLFDGPAALKTARQEYSAWKVLARVASVAACAVPFLLVHRATGTAGTVAKLLAAVGGAGIAFGLVYGSLAAPLTSPPANYLVPRGLILLAVGLLFLVVSVGAVSDNALVTLTRRELGTYFSSLVAYAILVGIAFVQWLGYLIFIGAFLQSPNDPGQREAAEPILAQYLPGTLIGPLAVMMLVPAITMRLFSEEKRTGTLEVLLTAPVSEVTVVLSKFFAAWLFYMLCWVPMGLFLVGLRIEGGQPFDYHPLLSLYVAVAVSGFAFIGMGLFFSSLTNNQAVAAMLTFVGMISLFMLNWHRYVSLSNQTAREVLELLSRASYWRLWSESLGGQIPVRDMLLCVSMAVFWLFLTVKSLQLRKWG